MLTAVLQPMDMVLSDRCTLTTTSFSDSSMSTCGFGSTGTGDFAKHLKSIS